MNTETYTASAPEEHLFVDDDIYHYQDAAVGQRFWNYFIDNLVMEFGIAFITGYLLGLILVSASPESGYNFLREHELLASYIISLVNYLLYYTICEKAFRGYTLGKLVTGTRAIREDGRELTFKDAFLRSLCRMVPFEAFSAWAEKGLWHDAWTRTRVIKAR